MSLRRRMMKRTEKGGLPVGYTRVEYLESTGTQYIITDYLVDTDISVFEIDMTDSRSAGDNMIFGVSDSGVGAWMETYEYSHYAAIGLSGYSKADMGIISGIIRFEMPAGILQKQDLSCTITRASKKYAEPLCIFARNKYGTPTQIEYPHKNLKIRSFVIYENDKVVRSYVPCIDASGRPCLFETVKRIPYYNAGTGEFLYGEILKE